MNTNERALSVAIVIVTLVATAARIQSSPAAQEPLVAAQAQEEPTYELQDSRRAIPAYTRGPRPPLKERIPPVNGPTVLVSTAEPLEVPPAEEGDDEVYAEEPAYTEQVEEPDVYIDMIEPMPELRVFNMSDQQVFDEAASLMDGNQRASFVAMWMTMSAAERRGLIQGLRAAFAGF